MRSGDLSPATMRPTAIMREGPAPGLGKTVERSLGISVRQTWTWRAGCRIGELALLLAAGYVGRQCWRVAQEKAGRLTNPATIKAQNQAVSWPLPTFTCKGD